MTFRAICISTLLLLPAMYGFANSQEKENRIYRTTKVSDSTPQIDGFINDEAWQQVDWSGNFTQRSPVDGASPSQPTLFKILYDQEYLYIAVRAQDDEPDKIVTRLSRRDGFEGDFVEVNIDSYFDKRTAYSFTATAAGVKGDEAITQNGNNWDAEWDPVWYLETQIDDKGWVAEMKIPLSQLRFNDNGAQTWGIQLTRYLYRKDEKSLWRYIPQEEAGWVNNFGELHGIEQIAPKKLLEVSPYTVTRMETYQADADNPFTTGREWNSRFGLNGKVGITNEFTLNFTVNPDFGQVEADPSEVNLTAFESYFQEKRPFFIEDRNITSFQLSEGGNNFSQDNLFYSRRIGRSPHRYPDVDQDNNEYADMPENTSILGAMKLTGKTKNGLSIGVMESLTAREEAGISRNGIKSSETVEPMTNYLLGRVQRDLDNTQVGAMFTHTHRFINDSKLNTLNSDAYTGGIDFEQYWDDKTYYLKTNFVASHVAGDTAAINALQKSSRRYYQRPDNSYTTLDTTLTSLSGHGGTVQVGKQGSSKLRFVGFVTWRSPGLELNDIGYLRQADAIFQVFWAGYRIARPFSIFRELDFNFNQWTGWDFGLNSNFKGGNASVSTKFKNHWTFSAGINLNGQERSNTLLRGGPSITLPGNWYYYTNLGTDERKKLTFGLNHFQNWGHQNYYYEMSNGISMHYRPADRLRFTLNPNFTQRKHKLQYLTTESYDNEKRYIFATLDQTTADLTCRMDLTLSPNLTLQYYGSPFITSVDYKRPKYISNPNATKFRDRYVEDVSFSEEDFEKDYDFNFQQFRSNLVLRWEYRPGSLLYLVWNQGRTNEIENGRFSYGPNLNTLFDVKPHNVFLAKLSYRFAY